MAAIPNPIRRVIAAGLLLLPSFALAADSSAPPESAESSRFGEDAPPPVHSEHFTVDAFIRGKERADILEKTFSDFIAVTNVQEESLPPQISVVIYPDEVEFRKKLHIRGGGAFGHASATRIETFEQRNINDVLVRLCALSLFDGAAGSPKSKSCVWLRKGLATAVVEHAARISPEESQLKLRDFLKKNHPVSFEAVAGASIDPSLSRRYDATIRSLTLYLIRQDKGLGIRPLLAAIQAGKNIDDAISTAYPGRYRTLLEFYDRWLKDELNMVRKPPAHITPKPSRR